MSQSPLARPLLIWVAVCALFAPDAAAQTGDTTADGRLRALYTAEWSWRQREMARRSDEPEEAGDDDHFPRVDAASQQARLAYWTRTLAALDSIPGAQLSPDEQVTQRSSALPSALSPPTCASGLEACLMNTYSLPARPL